MSTTLTETKSAKQAALDLTSSLGPSQSSYDQISPSVGMSDDLELMNIPSVVSRESGERDPLLLRDKLVSEQEIDGLKQLVLVLSI
jgi:hypothetical protein